MEAYVQQWTSIDVGDDVDDDYRYVVAIKINWSRPCHCHVSVKAPVWTCFVSQIKICKLAAPVTLLTWRTYNTILK